MKARDHFNDWLQVNILDLLRDYFITGQLMVFEAYCDMCYVERRELLDYGLIGD